MAKDVLSVSEVNNYINGMFETDFMLKNIRIQGEISNITYHTSGHIYFTLKDEDSCISGVMFRGNRVKGLTFPVNTGDSVIVTGRVAVYTAQGRYQIYAQSFEKAGIGELYLKFEKLKAEFQEMGMFDESYKREIPAFATKIGVVTARTGAAIHDIITTATRRNPHVQLTLYPSLVQGDGAAASIAEGIRTLDAMDFDVIIVGRGGGSMEDLWAFNEEEVAKAIFACDTPVISAVGHEVDYTIADFVADKRAATPTAAAELAVFEYDAFMENIDNLSRTLQYAIEKKLGAEKNRVELLKNILGAHSPHNLVIQYKMRLADISKRLDENMSASMVKTRYMIENYASKLEGLSPAKRLAEGYSYVVDDGGKNITKASQLKVNDELKIYLSEGTIKARVEDVNSP
ncbi:MAG: exodeoxyribonuclease VII large subunit [Lachnospiraceae bacterium]|nr:exodeoxyribonuclease VII large subunit [Lachnospiraceae bacterium]